MRRSRRIAACAHLPGRAAATHRPAARRLATAVRLAVVPLALGAFRCGLAAAPADDIRDIRGAKYVLPTWFVPVLIAAVLGGALLVYGIWRWRRSRRKPRPLLPFEIALQRLDGIRPLMQPATAREFSTAASDIVRVYIERRFGLTATHRTTEEFLHDLLQTATAALARHRNLLAEFLQQCDLVKFAGVSLSTQMMDALHRSARAFVLETAKPEPPPNVEGAHDTLPAT